LFYRLYLLIFNEIDFNMPNNNRLILTTEIFSQLQELVLVVDSDGAILESSGNVLDAKNIQEVIENKDWNSIYQIFQKCTSTLSPFVEIELELKISEKPIWYLCRIICLDDQPVGQEVYVLSFVNIEAQKTKENVLIKAKEHAQAQEKLKTNFIASVSHEIRTPMNSIIGFADLLRGTNDYQEKSQYIDIIRSSGQHLLNIINDIIDVSKIESGILNIKIQRININELLEELVGIYNSDTRLNAKEVTVKSQLFLNNEEAFMITDGTRLRQILSNLMDNAVKFTTKGEIVIGYHIFQKSDNEAQISFFVKDTGIGIPAEEQELIFDRFHQVSVGDEIKGSGLGLAIVDSLVKKIGGEITLISKKGEGSEFKFNIPFIKVRNEFSDKKEENVRNIKPDLKNRNILIAEDVPANYRLLSSILKGTFAKLTWVKNGKQAVEAILNNEDFDLILMDLRMPVMDGYKATKHIKSIDPKIPIIALTAFAFDGDMEKALNAGCDDYLSKPISIPKLYDKINFFLNM